MSFSAQDHALMARALALAELGACTTRPNPMVGCVIAHDGELVGEGWHRRAGEPHAEVHALRQAGERARGATAYVTLEPCAHHGRTPPCADALIVAGVKRVVAACGDPFVQVDGAGVERLRAAGIDTEVGLLQQQARELNRGFFSRIGRGRPWVRLKMAMSMDGRTALADGTSQWISSAASRADVARFRARSGAVMTGIETVLADDPRLTVRLQPPAEPQAFERPVPELAVVPPVRVVLDTHGRLPATSRLFAGGDAEAGIAAPLLWLTGPLFVPPAVLPGHVEHASVALHGGRIDLAAVLHAFAERGINEVQVESGATLAGALLQAGLVDELLLYVAPVLLGSRGRALFDGLEVDAMADRHGLTLLENRQVGNDLRLRLRPGH